MAVVTGKELRRSPRRRRSDALFWRLGARHAPGMGWLLESSETGLAFAYRGPGVPGLDSIIEVRVGATAEEAWSEQAVVRRVSRVHGDLTVVAAQYLRTRPFPPVAERAVATQEVEGRTPSRRVPVWLGAA
jgi:hypothetical protein